MTMTTTETTKMPSEAQPAVRADTSESPLSSPGPVEPGFTSQLFMVAATGLKVLDIQAPEGTEAVRLIAGTREVSSRDGLSWADLLESEDVRVEVGQYVTVVGRNVGPVKQRVRVTVTTRVVEGATPSAVRKPFKVAIATGPDKLVDPGVPIRFLLERGYVPYTLMFIKDGTPIPIAVRGAIVSAFEGAHAVRKEGAPPLPRTASVVEITLPSALRSRVAVAVRSILPLRLHADDRQTIVEAIEDALVNGSGSRPEETKPAGVSRTAVTLPASDPELTLSKVASAVDQLTAEAQRLRMYPSKVDQDVAESLRLLQNTLLTLEHRVADLEAAVKGQTDPSSTPLEEPLTADREPKPEDSPS